MKQYFPEVQQWLRLNIVHAHTELSALCPVLSAIICYNIRAVPKITPKPGNAALETQQESHSFEFNRLLTVVKPFTKISKRLARSLYYCIPPSDPGEVMNTPSVTK